jgi:hypothetical protein
MVIIEDSGIGREKSGLIRSRSLTHEKSFGLRIISERLHLMSDSSVAEIQDLKNDLRESIGTKVIVTIVKKTHKQ